MATTEALRFALTTFAPSVYYKSLTASRHHACIVNASTSVVLFPTQRSCAVVGSSSTLLKRATGTEIDSHDVVFRANTFPLHRRFLPYTGNRTTVTVTTHSRHIHLPRESIVYCHMPWFGRCWRDAPADGRPRVSPALIAHVKHRYGLRKWPSTGFLAVALADLLCARVSLYGFHSDPNYSNCSHYYNVGPHGKCVYPPSGHFGNSPSGLTGYDAVDWHDFPLERRMLRSRAALMAISRKHRSRAKNGI